MKTQARKTAKKTKKTARKTASRARKAKKAVRKAASRAKKAKKVVRKAASRAKKATRKSAATVKKTARKVASAARKTSRKAVGKARKVVAEKKAAMAATAGRVRLKTSPSEIDRIKGVWVLHFPRFGKEGEHFHTYGLLTPYFEGLKKGKLMATRCVNAKCPIGKGHGELWLPPRADCPDCHQPMVWEEIRDPRGYIYAYTKVERGGTGLEIETPYYQIDVKMPGVATIVKSWLLDRKPIKIGDKVRAVFRKGPDATNTCLDLCFELE